MKRADKNRFSYRQPGAKMTVLMKSRIINDCRT